MAKSTAPQVITMEHNIKNNKYVTERDKKQDLQNQAHLDA